MKTTEANHFSNLKTKVKPHVLRLSRSARQEHKLLMLNLNHLEFCLLIFIHMYKADVKWARKASKTLCPSRMSYVCNILTLIKT